jgi:hypothetical protein
VRHAELPVILSGEAKLVGGALTFAAQLLNPLGVDDVSLENLDVISAMHEIIVSPQLISMLVFDGQGTSCKGQANSPSFMIRNSLVSVFLKCFLSVWR